MTETEILTVIRDELARLAPEIDFETIDPATDIREQADLDSMDFLNLVTALHQQLGVDIPEAEVTELASLDSAVAYLKRKRAAAASA